MDIIAESRHKRPYVSHIIVCPQLMTHLWSKAFIKDAELMFAIPTGLSVWPNTYHESLCISLILPIIRGRKRKGPWVIRGIQLSIYCMESLE